VDSKEVEDTYIRLDKDLAELLSFLDKKVGQGKYTLFLTADHGALPSHPYLQKNRIPSVFLDNKKILKYVRNLVKEKFNQDDLIEDFSNFQLFYNHKTIKDKNIDIKKITDFILDNIINYEGVYKCYAAKELLQLNNNERIIEFTQNGYNQKISGDIIIIPNPGTVTYMKKGTEHGAGYGYDTHIPSIFYGYGIKKGSTNKYIPVIDIAPTLSYILKIEAPNGNKGKIIREVLK
jgi:arylsulfatase A-like enzyme